MIGYRSARGIREQYSRQNRLLRKYAENPRVDRLHSYLTLNVKARLDRELFAGVVRQCGRLISEILPSELVRNS